MEQSYFGCPVEMLQHEQEIRWLVERVKAAQPKNVLEVGSLFGGTLWCWMQTCPRVSHFVSVDVIVSENDPRHKEQLAAHGRFWNEWAEEREAKLKVFETDSTAMETVEAVRKEMPIVDFLFIDGDHRYDFARKDYDNYGALVREGGMIALHDIGAPENPLFGTAPLWGWIKSKNEGLTEELIMVPGERGIGILYKQGELQ